MNPTRKHLLTGVFIWLMANGLLQGQSMAMASIGKGQAFKLTGGEKYKNYTIQLCGDGVSKSNIFVSYRIIIQLNILNLQYD